ncbi:MAG: hypothetical protein RIR97_1878 [Pseudomonadota bacterium]
MTTGKILVSACLMGQAVRYDGKDKLFRHDLLERWKEEGRLVILCPEMSAGMPVPRLPAEIEAGKTADDVLAGQAKIMDIKGHDMTGPFTVAADNALALAREQGCAHALLIDGSPSCGSSFVYDGTFSGKRISGAGLVAAHLRNNGIKVWQPARISDLADALGEPGL